MKGAIQALRRIRYRLLSNMSIVSGKPDIRQPALFCGKGRIIFDRKVCLGYSHSQFFFSGYLHLEARTPDAVIKIGSRTYNNNNCVLISEGAGIEIGRDFLIGPEICIFDSDFHGVLERRRPKRKISKIGDNVLIGGSAIIVKGVRVGSNSTIAAGAVVTEDVPENTLSRGIPPKW